MSLKKAILESIKNVLLLIPRFLKIERTAKKAFLNYKKHRDYFFVLI